MKLKYKVVDSKDYISEEKLLELFAEHMYEEEINNGLEELEGVLTEDEIIDEGWNAVVTVLMKQLEHGNTITLGNKTIRKEEEQ